MIRKIRSVKETVYWLLTDYPETRDNDRLLMCKVWAEQNAMLRMGSHSFVGFAEDFILGKYADPESIRRARQLLQEQHPSLRGKSYKERHKEAEEMRQEIKKEHYPLPLMRDDRKDEYKDRKDLFS